MDLTLTEEQRLIQEVARDFAERELLPIAADLDRECRFPLEITRKMGELGLMGITVPAEYGGAGADFVSLALAMEEISRGCAGTSVAMTVNNSLVCQPLLQFGSEEQRRAYLMPAASGQKFGCYALTEPQSGSDAAHQETSARREGDEWVLNGRKVFISSALYSDFLIVYAQTDREAGSHGITAFLVDQPSPGLEVGKNIHKLGINASTTSELVFSDCRVPARNVLGEVGQGFRIAMQTLDAGRIGIGAQAVGIARAAYEEALRYARERYAFGKPITEFQAIQFKLADMATQIEAARLLVLRAAQHKDADLPVNKEAAMAKLFASTMAQQVTRDAVQIHGGYGYTKEYAAERHFRDAKITEIYEGTSEIMHLVIARNLLREEGG